MSDFGHINSNPLNEDLTTEKSGSEKVKVFKKSKSGQEKGVWVGWLFASLADWESGENESGQEKRKWLNKIESGQ